MRTIRWNNDIYDYVTENCDEQIDFKIERYKHHYITLAFIRKYRDRIVNIDKCKVMTDNQIWNLYSRKNTEKYGITIMAFKYFDEVLTYDIIMGYCEEKYMEYVKKYYTLPNIMQHIRAEHVEEYIKCVTHIGLKLPKDFIEKWYPDYYHNHHIVRYLEDYDAFERYIQMPFSAISYSKYSDYLDRMHEIAFKGEYQKYYELIKNNIHREGVFMVCFSLYEYNPLRQIILCEEATLNINKILNIFRCNSKLFKVAPIQIILNKIAIHGINHSDTSVYFIPGASEFVAIAKADPTILKYFDDAIKAGKAYDAKLIKFISKRYDIIELVPKYPQTLIHYETKLRLIAPDEEHKSIDKYETYITQCLAYDDYRFLDMVVNGQIELTEPFIIPNQQYLQYIAANRTLYSLHYEKFAEYGCIVADAKRA